MAPSKVTAFELDPERVGDSDAHAYTFGGFPGRWQVGRPTLPAALGLTVTRMRELIAQFNLPLVEVQVAENKAFDTFEEDPQRILSGPLSNEEPVQTERETIIVNGQPLPSPVVPSQHPPLQPFAAEQIARDTARLYPGDAPDEIVADIPVVPDSEAEAAALAAAGEGEE